MTNPAPTPPPIPADLLQALRRKTPLLWLNVDAEATALPVSPLPQDIEPARARLARCAGLLQALFPALASSQGRIESPLQPLPKLQARRGSDPATDGTWLLKADHALPVAGSIKARGGFHEVLAFAESVALQHGLIRDGDDRTALASPTARECFARYTVTVGSTGNLGMGIGLMAAALGFRAVVHMSTDAKAWKKDRLRRHGVQVVEHAGDYAEAVAAGRAAALADPHTHFVDDEHSLQLFLGYAVAAQELAAQLTAAGRRVDAEHPLFVYLPCGVGGAPGGIAFGLKALFGAHVHCFFAEPVASPCMLVQLAAGTGSPVSVYDIGLDNRTEADGLAVGLASPLVAPLMARQLAGVYTASDAQLFDALLDLVDSEGIELEPSAAAGIPGPRWVADSDAGRRYLRAHRLEAHLPNATHVIWSTGGSLVPAEAHARFQAEARRLRVAGWLDDLARAAWPAPASPGMPLAAVDTPALVMDLDAFEHNLARLRDMAAAAGVALRPHAKAHKCPAIALAQIAHGAVGICCQKVSEALPFLQAGVRDIHISNETIAGPKVDRLAEMARHGRFSICVDDLSQVADLARATATAGSTLRVLVEIDIGQNRCGVSDVASALTLADAIAAHPQLRFGGLQAYHGGLQHLRGHAERREAARRASERTTAFVDALARRGIHCETVTGGGTGSVEFDLENGVYTELQPGSYVFMDADYAQNEFAASSRFAHSLFVATQVMSRTHATRAVVDAGLKSIAVDSGLPTVWGEGAVYTAANDEHGILQLPDDDAPPPALGSLVLLVPGHCDPTLNLHDELVVFRDGRVEGVWPIAARGLSR